MLKGPEWDDPEIVQFEAVHPRPEVTATYEVRLPSSSLHLNGHVWQQGPFCRFLIEVLLL